MMFRRRQRPSDDLAAAADAALAPVQTLSPDTRADQKAMLLRAAAVAFADLPEGPGSHDGPSASYHVRHVVHPGIPGGVRMAHIEEITPAHAAEVAASIAELVAARTSK